MLNILKPAGRKEKEKPASFNTALTQKRKILVLEVSYPQKISSQYALLITNLPRIYRTGEAKFIWQKKSLFIKWTYLKWVLALVKLRIELSTHSIFQSSYFQRRYKLQVSYWKIMEYIGKYRGFCRKEIIRKGDR